MFSHWQGKRYFEMRNRPFLVKPVVARSVTASAAVERGKFLLELQTFIELLGSGRSVRTRIELGTLRTVFWVLQKADDEEKDYKCWNIKVRVHYTKNCVFAIQGSINKTKQQKTRTAKEEAELEKKSGEEFFGGSKRKGIKRLATQHQFLTLSKLLTGGSKIYSVKES